MESGHLLTFKLVESELDMKGKLKGHMSGFNDFDWYPWMSSSLSGSDIFLTTSKDLPIQLWSSSEGKVVCTWVAKDHLDQIANCLSVSFSPDGQKFVSGGENKLWLFDTNRPGDSAIVEYPTISSKKSKNGQNGLLSCLNFRYDNTGVFASGSFKGSIGIYDLRSLEQKGPACCIFEAHRAGVSQIKFLDDGWSLITAGRREGVFKKWDLRMLQEVSVPNEPVTEFFPYDYAKNNQRIFFDTLGSKLCFGARNSLCKFEMSTSEESVMMNFKNIVSSISASKDGLLAASTGTRIFGVDSESEFETSRNNSNFNTITILKPESK